MPNVRWALARRATSSSASPDAQLSNPQPPFRRLAFKICKEVCSNLTAADRHLAPMHAIRRM